MTVVEQIMTMDSSNLTYTILQNCETVDMHETVDIVLPVCMYCFITQTLLHAFNDLYISTNKHLPLIKCFDNYVSVNLKLPS